MSDLLAEWKKRDPFLLDLEGFQRFSDAHDLKRLIRLGHPDEYGESYRRLDVIKTIEERGMRILDDLGWSSDPNAYYKQVGGYRVERLGQILAFARREDAPPEENMFHLLEMYEPTTQTETLYPDLTSDDEIYAIDRAIDHIANDYIPKMTRAIYEKEGRAEALKFLKGELRSFGTYCFGKPGVTGTSKGVLVHWGFPTIDPPHVYKERRISFGRILDYILDM